MIKKLIQELSQTNDEKYCIVCTVDSVDETALTCYCLPIDQSRADLPGVRLVADTQKIGFVKFPKVGSIVIVSFLTNEAGYISDCNDVDKVYLNGSSYGGLIKVDDLLTEYNNRLATLKTAITTALTSLDASIVALSGASTSSAAFTASTATLTNILSSQVTNTTIKHGAGN